MDNMREGREKIGWINPMRKFQVAMYKSDFRGLCADGLDDFRENYEENASALTPKKGMAMEENNE